MKKNITKIIIFIQIFILSICVNYSNINDVRCFASHNKFQTANNSANIIITDENETLAEEQYVYEEYYAYTEPVYEYVAPYVSDEAYQVLALVNQARRENGLNELYMDYTLVEVANVRSEEATRNWSHTRPDGSSYATVFTQYNVFGTVGENLAYGQKTPEAVFNAWMNSPSHKDNILYAGFNRVGISIYIYNGTIYWAQEFAN